MLTIDLHFQVKIRMKYKTHNLHPYFYFNKIQNNYFKVRQESNILRLVAHWSVNSIRRPQEPTRHFNKEKYIERYILFDSMNWLCIYNSELSLLWWLLLCEMWNYRCDNGYWRFNWQECSRRGSCHQKSTQIPNGASRSLTIVRCG